MYEHGKISMHTLQSKKASCGEMRNLYHLYRKTLTHKLYISIIHT